MGDACRSPRSGTPKTSPNSSYPSAAPRQPERPQAGGPMAITAMGCCCRVAEAGGTPSVWVEASGGGPKGPDDAPGRLAANPAHYRVFQKALWPLECGEVFMADTSLLQRAPKESSAAKAGGRARWWGETRRALGSALRTGQRCPLASPSPGASGSAGVLLCSGRLHPRRRSHGWAPDAARGGNRPGPGCLTSSW